MAPFVDDLHRHQPDMSIPGDRCFVAYKAFMEMWAKEPRWTTIDKMAEAVWPDPHVRACALAILVFMHKHGYRYEDRKCFENGDIQ